MKLPGRDNASRISRAPYKYNMLDAAPDVTFENFANLAALICEAPLAMITLTNNTRRWVKAKPGSGILKEIAQDIGFNSYTILQRDVVIVPDALADERFASDPLVASGPRFRFYAGAPLIAREGYALGTISVFDRVPRNLNRKQVRLMVVLAEQVARQLESSLYSKRILKLREFDLAGKSSGVPRSSLLHDGSQTDEVSAQAPLHIADPQNQDLLTAMLETLKNEILKHAGQALLREAGTLDETDNLENKISFYDEVRRLEIEMIEYALAQTGGKQRSAARLLNMKASTLHAKIKQYNIAVRTFSHKPVK